MATHTQIIDLYGIPACGKSTLAENLTKLSSEKMKMATMVECIHSARKNKLKFFRSFSSKNILASVRLKISVPIDSKRKAIPLWNILIMGVYKEYVRKYTNYDIVVTDHGDIQRFVSLERGDDLHESKKFLKACDRYLDVSLSTNYVYCRINAEEALRRMNGRGREKGRIDLIKDPKVKLQELEKETKCFDFWTSMLKEKGFSVIELNMEQSSPMIADKLLSFIQKESNR